MSITKRGIMMIVAAAIIIIAIAAGIAIGVTMMGDGRSGGSDAANGRQEQTQSDTQTAAFPEFALGGTAITADEFDQAMKTAQNETISHFSQTYQVNLNADDADWTAKHGSETPIDYLARQTVNDLRTRHATYRVGMSIGAVASDDYPSIVSRMRNANQTNADKRANGEVVYGRSEYDIDMYIDYELTALKNAYIDNDGNPGMALSDKDVQDYYDAHDWTVEGVDGKAPLSDVKANVKVQLREERYRAIIAKEADSISLADVPWAKLRAYALGQLD